MILTLVLVGDEHINDARPYIRLFSSKGWIVEILTDQPEKLKGIGYDNINLHQYNEKIFSYFNKLIFPIQISKKYKSGVLYIDSSLLFATPKTFIESFKNTDSFLYYKNWPNGEKLNDYKDDIYFSKIIDYFIAENVEKYEDLITILEWIYYIPYYENKVDQLLYDIEKIKPIFEYTSVIFKPHYNGIGNAEGLALSYILNKNLIPLDKFTNFEFDFTIKNRYIKFI